MIDTPGLGWLPSPDDANDWAIDALHAATGVPVPDALPASYAVPAPLPPVLDQGSSPMCVSYSAAGEQMWFDLRDVALKPDEPLFFKWIGGTPSGAFIRDALATRLSAGYPPAGHADQAGRHRVAAYSSVPLTRDGLCSAILAFGPVVVGTPWYSSWFHPDAHGVLPAPDSVAGGHAILAVGWDATGLRLRNSWGAGWGIGGDCVLPWSMLGHLREAWKAVDVIDPKPSTTHWRVRIAPHALVRQATLSATGCIAGWTTTAWGALPSGAPCRQPVVKRGCVRGQATLAYVTAGQFKGRWVRLGSGVTASSSTAATAEEDPTA